MVYRGRTFHWSWLYLCWTCYEVRADGTFHAVFLEKLAGAPGGAAWPSPPPPKEDPPPPPPKKGKPKPKPAPPAPRKANVKPGTFGMPVLYEPLPIASAAALATAPPPEPEQVTSRSRKPSAGAAAEPEPAADEDDEPRPVEPAALVGGMFRAAVTSLADEVAALCGEAMP